MAEIRLQSAFAWGVVLWIGLAVLGPGSASGADVELITQGREVDLEAHLVPGKLVLFDFYADWCMPCRMLEPHVDRLAALHEDSLAVRKLDVIDWESPVARQYRISSLPHFMLYGPDGALIAAGDTERVFGALEARLGEGAALPAVRSRRGSELLAVAALVTAAVIGAGLLRRRRIGSGEAGSVHDTEVADPAAESPPVWYAMIGGSLEGPFSVEHLVKLRQRREVDDESRVRRKGEATWRRLAEIIDQSS